MPRPPDPPDPGHPAGPRGPSHRPDSRPNVGSGPNTAGPNTSGPNTPGPNTSKSDAGRPNAPGPHTPWPFDPAPPPHLTGDDDARAEMESHLELLVDELVASGLAPDEARREARARFGDPVAWQKKTQRSNPRRTGTTTTMMTRILQDLRFALRGFRRSPGFAVMAVLTLAVALAGNTALFSVLDSAVLRALPFPGADGLVFVNGVHRTNGEEAVRLASWPEFRDWRERSRTLDPVVAARSLTLTMTGVSEADRVSGEIVTEGYFPLLGGEAVVGRAFTPDEYQPGDAHPVVVISHDLWQRAFAGAPDVVGRTLELDERTVEVVGVMAEGFAGVSLESDLWIPTGMFTLMAPLDVYDARGSRFLPVMGRLAPGATLEEAQAEFEGIATALQAEHPDAHEDRFARLVGFRDGFLGPVGDLLWILFGAGMLLLVIAAANVANLLLVRAHARTRELTVRRAMGADTGRITEQLLTESVTLAVLGGAVGLFLARWVLQGLLAVVPDGALPAYAQPSLSGRAFVFTLLVLLAVGVASGLVPALTSARRDLAATLRSGRGALGGRGNRAQKLFVVTQVGLALMLLVGAGLLSRSLDAQLSVDPGLEIAGIHAFRVQPPQATYADPESVERYYEELVRRVGEVPGVGAVALSSDIPFRGGSSGSYAYRVDAPEERIRIHRHSVSPGFFDLLGVELVAGRPFALIDDADAPGVVVVSEAFVTRVFPEDPSPAAAVGRQVWAGPPNDPANLAEIVGVVENVRFRNLTQSMMDGPNSPDLFYALGQVPSRGREVSFTVVGDVDGALAAVQAAVRGLEPSAPPFGLASLAELYRGQIALPRLAAVLMGAFSLLALSLAAVGIYGVLTFSVGQRGPEIALRRALGAEAGDVARSVVWDALRLAGVGVAVGGGVALLGGGVLESLLFQVSATDWVTLGVTALALLAVASLAAAVPAVRAARKAPADALSAE